MSRTKKSKYIGGRVDEVYFAKVLAYIEATSLETQGQLVRAAVDEYILNHPIKLTERPKGI